LLFIVSVRCMFSNWCETCSCDRKSVIRLLHYAWPISNNLHVGKITTNKASGWNKQEEAYTG